MITELDTLRVGGAFDPRRIRNCDGIVVVGSSGAGKSYHIGAARNSSLSHEGVIQFPTRLITRARRKDDDLDENQHVTRQHFETACAGGILSVFWPRSLVKGTTEYYGFYHPVPGSLPIYSANNAILRCRQCQVDEFLRTKLIVGIYASDAVRERRLRSRSPDLFLDRPDEVRNRLGDSSEGIPPFVDFVIDTNANDSGSTDSRIDFVRLIQQAAIAPSSLL